MNNSLRQIKAAMYTTPTNYKTSQEYYTWNLQQKVNETFDFASDVEEIEEEHVFGTLVYSPIVCRINHAIDPKTGNNVGDDFRELIFKDLSIPKFMGQRYRFQNSDWITVKTDQYRYVTKSALLRRCGNVLRWVDLETKRVVSEPVIVDYTLKYANIYFNHTVDITQGTLLLTAQYNDFTKQIRVNDRFVMGGSVYKVKTILDALRYETYNQEVTPLITFDVYVDAEAADDNFSPITGRHYNPVYPENIANYERYKHIFESNQTGDLSIKIEPDITSIPLNETVEFSCYMYDDYGNRTSSIFDFEFSGLTSAYYTGTVIDGNHFMVLNKKPNVSKKLMVTCISGEYKKEILLEMGGIF